MTSTKPKLTLHRNHQLGIRLFNGHKVPEIRIRSEEDGCHLASVHSSLATVLDRLVVTKQHFSNVVYHWYLFHSANQGEI